MNLLVILGHPQKNSFNHAIAKTVINTLNQLGHSVVFHDLYAEDFDPVFKPEEILTGAKLDDKLTKYVEELVAADGIVIVHPNWWGQPPAMLKGWVDRVFKTKIAYRFEDTGKGEGIPIGLLKANKAVIFNTSNTKEEREKTTFGDPLETLWKTCIFGLCGVKNVHRKMFAVIVTSTKEQRKEWLEEVVESIKKEYPKT